ncbi:hypothetical protein P3G55_06595 [Leptospira sp. 96542]|nr:hypothetical protein [Leptospira sp. 96542]
MENLDEMNLHLLMEKRLESILEEMHKKPKHGARKKQNAKPNPANREVAEWNLSEIPVLFGA